MKKLLLSLSAALLCTNIAFAANVTVKMNSTSPTMCLVSKATNDTVDVGTPDNNVYSFDAPEGVYVLTAYAKDKRPQRYADWRHNRFGRNPYG